MGDLAASASNQKLPPAEEEDPEHHHSKRLLLNNKFVSLKDGDAGNTAANPPKRKQKQQQQQQQQQKQQQAQQKPQRKEKCPPVFVYGDPPDLRPDLRKLIAKGLKCTFRLCSESVKLMVEGRSHFDKVLEYLEEKQYQYYTHDIPGAKPLKVVLHGLDDMPVEDLVEELGHCGLKPTNVYKIARHDKSRKYRDQLYLVHLENGSKTLKELKDVSVVNSTVVEWHKYKPMQRDVTP